MGTQTTSLPRVGMLATLRNRRGIISDVEAFDAGAEGRLHLITVDYTDGLDPTEETVLWEREVGIDVWEPTSLPDVEHTEPMPLDRFQATVNAARWSARSPFLAPGKPSSITCLAPLFGAVQVDDYQLHPLIKALEMPRISLLLADDVGLGKTIEAGLILHELLLRRRIRKVLILSPAALRFQWQQEMKDKFSLDFEVLDREHTLKLQKRMGLDANPWRAFPKIIASYHYFKQVDVLEQFRQTTQQAPGTAQLPWDLLIVDEAHNLTPSNFGQDSDLAQMLREISPYFEHKLFLTATPHNGHTRSFTGLLEQLDPVRFTQKSELSSAERQRLQQVVVRRLKRDINVRDEQLGRFPRFPNRKLEALPLFFGKAELNLMEAFQAFRKKVKRLIAQRKRQEQLAGNFAIEVLNKRLLSSPFTFAQSWLRFKAGMDEQQHVEVKEVVASQRLAGEESDDDREAEQRSQHATKTTGQWLRPLAAHLEDEIQELDQALERLGLNTGGYPRDDARVDKLLELIRHRLREGSGWTQNERLIVFTEYKTTLDYIKQKLLDAFKDPAAILSLFGGMDDTERQEVKRAFNDEASPVRILLATDAASEGLNLQETARYLLHFEIPWNPSRLEQRNGRLDRHGQARDVTIFHFTSTNDADLNFLGRVVEKVDTIREDLGATGELFDAAFQRRFLDEAQVDQTLKELDGALGQRQKAASLEGTDRDLGSPEHETMVQWLRDELNLYPDSLDATLSQVLPVRRDPVQGKERLSVRTPLQPQWKRVVDDHLRIKTRQDPTGKLPELVFDPNSFMTTKNQRPVFRPRPDATLLHLNHPIFRQAMAQYSHRRFSKDVGTETRWTVSSGTVPEGADLVVRLTVEELAVNELREPFHHWVRTLQFSVFDGALRDLLPHVAARHLTHQQVLGSQNVKVAQQIWDDIKSPLRKQLTLQEEQLSNQIQAALKGAQKDAITSAKAMFDERIKEVTNALKESSIQKLQQELDQLQVKHEQQALFEHLNRDLHQKIDNLTEELQRRQQHYQGLLTQLEREKERVLTLLIPKRFQLKDQARVFPISIEFIFPEVKA